MNEARIGRMIVRTTVGAVTTATASGGSGGWAMTRTTQREYQAMNETTTQTTPALFIYAHTWPGYPWMYLFASERRKAKAYARLERRYHLPPLGYTIQRLDRAIERCREALQ